MNRGVGPRQEERALSLEPAPPTKRLSRRLFRAAGRRGTAPDRTVGDVVEGLGDRSFGWLILIFALVNMIPMPVGATLITSIPLILVTAQMALGLEKVRLPGFLTRRGVNRRSFQRRVLWLGPVIRQAERVVKRRHEYVFTPGPERALGAFLLCVSLALFLPIPLSGYLPATALFVAAVGIVERDGLLALAGAGLGVVALIVTATVGAMIFLGAQALTG